MAWHKESARSSEEVRGVRGIVQELQNLHACVGFKEFLDRSELFSCELLLNMREHAKHILVIVVSDLQLSRLENRHNFRRLIRNCVIIELPKPWTSGNIRRRDDSSQSDSDRAARTRGWSPTSTPKMSSNACNGSPLCAHKKTDCTFFNDCISTVAPCSQLFEKLRARLAQQLVVSSVLPPAAPPSPRVSSPPRFEPSSSQDRTSQG